MTLQATRAFLWVAIALTVCQDTRGFSTSTNDATNATRRQYDEYGNYHEYIPTNNNHNWLTNKIAGGSHAEYGQFPFMAVVHRLLGAGKTSQCGGTILTRRWVLTAGHCLGNFPHEFLVVFGIVDKSGIGYDFNRGPGVSMITTRAIIHPQYSQSVNDIGLLHMPNDIPFSNIIQPIRLASDIYTERSFDHKTAYTIGWGRDTPSSTTGTKYLKYATLPIIPNHQCRRYWDVVDKNICTAPGLGQDACQGDSGGPLIVTEDGAILQIGIVSYGDAGCPSSRPGVFTRVSSYARWIQSVTQT